jgi:hypothetical protein
MIDAKSLVGKDGLYPDDIAETLANADPEKKSMLLKIGKAVVDHDRYDKAMTWLNDIYSEHGTGRESSVGLLYGEPGVGKSTVLRMFAAKRAGPFETSQGSRRPVVLVEVPANPKETHLFDAFLIALGAEHLCVGDAEDRKRAVETQLRLQHVHLAILDEFTHVIEDRSEYFTKKAVRQLKGLINGGTCQFVFAGTNKLVGLHSVYKQINRRTDGDFLLTCFGWDDEDDREEWIGVLETIEDALTIPASPALTDEVRARNLHKATKGNINNLMKLLFRATAIAYDEGDTELTDVVFADAVEFRRRGDGKLVNPFGRSRRRVRKPTLSEMPPDAETEMTGLRKGNRQDRDSFSKR